MGEAVFRGKAWTKANPAWPATLAQVAALPLLALWSMLIGIIQTPLGNILSRKYEFEADEYAVNETKKPAEFINTLNKLNEQNLGDKEPHPFVEWFFYSHPSIKNRIAAIETFAMNNDISLNKIPSAALENTE